MSSYIVTIGTKESEKDFEDFLQTHHDVEAKPNEAIEYDPSIYDENGNFQRINLAGPGLPVPPEYIQWRLEQSMASPSMTWEEAKVRLEERRKQYKANKL